MGISGAEERERENEGEKKKRKRSRQKKKKRKEKKKKKKKKKGHKKENISFVSLLIITRGKKFTQGGGEGGGGGKEGQRESYHIYLIVFLSGRIISRFFCFLFLARAAIVGLIGLVQVDSDRKDTERKRERG